MTAGYLARVLFALAAALLPALAPALEPARTGELAAGIFRIQATDAQRRTSTGTAVLVAPHTLVTSCHVVLGAHEITLNVGSQELPVAVLRADAEHDVCLIAGPSLDGPLAMLGDTVSLVSGAPIAAAGYSRKGGLAWTTGQVEGLFSYDLRGRVIQGSAPFDEGASGGGLFDEDGRLVGILTFKARAGGPFHFAVPVEWVIDLLADKAGAPKGGTARAFWQHTNAKRPVFLRVATLAAQGNCTALAEVAGQWLKNEPDNPEAGMAARNMQHCQARLGSTR